MKTQTWLDSFMNSAYREKDMNKEIHDFIEEKPRYNSTDSCVAPVIKEDMVNSPSHYNYGEIECIDAIRAMLGEEGFVSYCKGNALKYTWRAGLKSNETEDLKKAAWYNRMAAGDDPREDEASLAKSIALQVAMKHYE